MLLHRALPLVMGLLFFGSYLYFVEGLQELRLPLMAIGLAVSLPIAIASRASPRLVLGVVAFAFCGLASLLLSQWDFQLRDVVNALAFYYVVMLVTCLRSDLLEFRSRGFLVLCAAAVAAGMLTISGVFAPINPNAAAFNLLAVQLLVTLVWLQRRGPIGWVVVVSLICFAAIMQQIARTSMGASLTALLVLLWLGAPKHRLLLLAATIAAFGVMIGIGLHEQVVFKFTYYSQQSNITNSRLEMWQEGVEALQWYPRSKTAYDATAIYSLHNSYLALALVFGVLQALLMLAATGAALLVAWRRKRLEYLAIVLPLLMVAMFEEVLSSHVFFIALFAMRAMVEPKRR